ncbi:MAG: hypothetical protein VYA26_10705 [Actinomycetota bacterium]|nr:hypothetical protein [Actinomycetota bacterium]
MPRRFSGGAESLANSGVLELIGDRYRCGIEVRRRKELCAQCDGSDDDYLAAAEPVRRVDG